MTTDWPDDNPSQHRANAISVTGVPLLKFSNVIVTNTSQTIPPATRQTLISGVAINQPSWEFGATLSIPAGTGTVPFARFSFDWFDTTGLIRVASDNVEVPMGNGPSNVITIVGRGPCKGATLTVALQNADPAQTLTVTYNVYQTSHTFILPQFEQTQVLATAPNGFTYSGADPGARIVASSSPALTPGTPVNRLLVVAFGKWRFTVDNSAGANALSLKIQTVTGITIAAGFNVVNITVPAGAVSTFEVSMPSAPMLMILTNTGGAGNITPATLAVFEPY